MPYHYIIIDWDATREEREKATDGRRRPSQSRRKSSGHRRGENRLAQRDKDPNQRKLSEN